MNCEGSEIFDRLSEEYHIDSKDFVAFDVWISSKDPFKVLVATILSQNTTDKSTYKSFKTLEEKVGVEVKKIADADYNLISESIRFSGLNNSKAKKLKEIAQILLKEYHGDLWNILNESPETSRKILISLPGVGDKTADVVLLTCKGYEAFPVDTHIRRIAVRLGIAKERETYTVISNRLMTLFHGKDFLKAHHLLITHGRKTCKANKPLCQICPINYCCEFYKRKDNQGRNQQAA
ncbi:endonuclease III domain-containing protein [Sulfuracidifex tepidarius]|nr:endonuclease III [Sulfuracidifex tepidarius]